MRLAISACILCALLAVAGIEPAQRAPTRATRRIMGTFCEVQVYHEDAAVAARAAAAALDEMSRVDRLLSNYDPASELSAMNREASRAPFRVSEELYDFVASCREYAAMTDRAFDPTVGALVRAWGFFTRKPARPSPAALLDAQARVGIDKVRLDPDGRTVSYAVAGLELDPGGIGKGYAVDRAVGILRKMGIESALVSAGGSTLYGLGRPPGRDAWRVGVNDPQERSRLLARVLLRDTALSTSGAAEQSVVVDGRRYTHIFDPRTRTPVEDMCQVTVVAPTATDSDALTKAAFVLPHERAVQVLSALHAVHMMRMEGACDKRTRPWVAPWSTGVFEQGGR